MAELAIVFKGSDETKAAVDEVAGGLKGVGTAADEASGKGSGLFSNLLSTAGGFLAANVIGSITSQITDFVSGGIEAARDTNKLVAETQSLIESTGGAAKVSVKDVTDLATALSASMGKSLFGDDQIQKAENVILKYRELKVPIADVTRLATDMAQRLGTEPAAAAETLGRALQKPEDAAGRLAKMGIVLTDAQEAMIKKMIAAGDQAGAQSYLMEQLNGSFGGAAEAAAKADGGMAQMKDRMGEAAETIGGALLPVIGKLGGLALDYLIPAVETVATWIGENLPAAIDTVSGAFDAVMGVISSVIASFSSAGESSSGLGGIVNQLGVIWQQVEGIIQVAVELIDATVVPAFQTIASFLMAHGEEIKGILSGVWEVIQGVIKVALSIIQGVLQTALALIKGDWSGAWDAIKTMFSGVWEGIKQILSGALQIVENELSMAWDAIKGAVEDAWNGIKETVNSAIDSVIEVITGLPDRVASVGSDLVAGIKDGFSSSWDSFVNWVIRQLDGLKDQVLSFFGISSPSRVMAEEVGEPLVLGILQGMENTLPDLYSLMDDMGKTLTDKVQAIADKVSETLANGFDATASIDRLMAKNLDALGDISDAYRDQTKAQLDIAAQEAAQIADPEQAAKYYKMRSAQILELAKLSDDREKARQAGDMDAVARYDRQIQLIQQAQEAEQRAYEERQKHAKGGAQDLIAQIGALMDSAVLGESTSPEARAAVQALYNLLVQLESATAPPAPAPATAGTASTQGARTASTQSLAFHIDARGATMSERQFEDVVRRVLAQAGAQADSFMRTGR